MASPTDTGAPPRSLYDAEGGIPAAFSGKVADYSAYKPDYPDGVFELLKSICAPAPDVTVADVGAGTGLSTQGLLRHGYRVVAVEPGAEMRRAYFELTSVSP